MKRLVIVMVCLFIVFACSKKESDTAATHTTTSEAKSPSQEPRQMIPDKSEQPIVLAAIKPYFDEAGMVTEKTISPGDNFELFVFAEYKETNLMSAAEYKLILPEGISILGSVETDSSALQSGKVLTDYAIAFRCTPGPKVFLVKYNCLAGPDFSGGVIQTAEGDGSHFIGLADCNTTPMQHEADKGQAVLKVK
jgi:hypothetical protein